MEKISWTKEVFLFRFHILCEGGPQGVQIWLFSMFISIIYSFIYLIHSYFQILLVCEEC